MLPSQRPSLSRGRSLSRVWLRLLVAALLLPVLAAVAHADPRQHRERGPQERPGQRPMREAIGEVEQNYRGHVVDVQSLRQGASEEDVYRMRVLQRDGRVKTVTVPAKGERR